MAIRNQLRCIIAWGSYDESKPRVRLLLSELRARGMLSAEINIPVWVSVRDKAIVGSTTLAKQLLTLFAAYPGALLKLIRQPSRSALLLPYPAIPDIFVAAPVARIRGQRIIFDAFISLHDTIVTDRRLAPAGGLASKLLWWIEWLALRLADVILVDTDQHADFFASEFGISRDQFQTVLVGAEPPFWANGNGSKPPPPDRPPRVLFYGQLIPLHGLDTILDAIQRTEGDDVEWLLVGSGQEEVKLRHFLAEHGRKNVSWKPWVDYGDLPALISTASVGLGVFGTGDKAARVIPNKVFQILAAGRPVITRASPAVDAIAQQFPDLIFTVPAGDGAALAEAILEAVRTPRGGGQMPCGTCEQLGPASGVSALIARLSYDAKATRLTDGAASDPIRTSSTEKG